jgi:hypothetical protein
LGIGGEMGYTAGRAKSQNHSGFANKS